MANYKLFSELVSADNLEWTYSMRREMQEIIPGVFLGPFSAAIKSKLDHLQEVGITHIICVRQDVEAHFIRPNFPERIRYLIFDISDLTTMNIIQFLPMVKHFIDGSLRQGGKVLVHGNSGISRSASLVIGYVMESYGLQFKDAFSLVQHKRFCINPNEGFLQQLREYEPIYKAKRTLQNGQTSQVTGKLKRRFDEIEESECQMDVCESENGGIL